MTTTTLLRHVRPALFALAVTLPVAAFAQSASAPEQAPAPATPSASPAQHHHGHGHGPVTDNDAGRVEQHINALHAALHITPALEPQWDAMATVMRQNAAAMDQEIAARRASVSSMTALDDMQSYQKLADQHAANMQKLVAAFSTLYGAMSEEQKQAADAYFRHEAMQQSARR
jgi:protein CpxP